MIVWLNAIGLLILLVILFLVIKFGERLRKVEELEKVFSKIDEKNRDFFELQKSFLYEKIGKMEEKLFLSAKENQTQIAKNVELFNKFDKNLSEFANDTKDKLSRHFFEFSNSLGDFKEKLFSKLSSSFEELSEKVSKNLEKISYKVDERLKEGFENVDKTFKDIITGIAKISEAQKNIESLSREVVSLQNILSDKKSRGVF